MKENGLSEVASGDFRMHFDALFRLKSTAGKKNRFTAMHGCGRSGEDNEDLEPLRNAFESLPMQTSEKTVFCILSF